MVNQKDWTEEDCLHLVREFRSRRVLWDTKHPMYYRSSAKNTAWQELSSVVGIPIKACRHKMVVLMSSFRREKFKIVNSLKARAKNPSKPIYKSRWFAFKDMAFMIDRSKYNKEVYDEATDLIRSDVERYIEESSTSDVKQPNSTDNDKKVIKTEMEDEYGTKDTQEDEETKATECFELSTTQSALKTALNSSQDTTDDEIYSFTNFIASKMKTYDKRTKTCVQKAICDIIFDADNSSF